MRSTPIIFAAAAILGILAWRLCLSPPVAASNAPNLPQRWNDQVYGLDDGEVFRLIVPPYTPERQKLAMQYTRGAAWTQFAYIFQNGSSVFGGLTAPGPLASQLARCGGIAMFEVDVQSQLRDLRMAGDTVIREGTTTSRRMEALQSVASASCGRSLVIQMKDVERDVLLVRGTLKLNPPKHGAEKRFYFERPDPAVASLMTATLEQTLKWLGIGLSCRVIDETEGPGQKVLADPFPFLASMEPAGILKERFEQQTSLKLVEARRVVPVWIVVERDR